MKDIVWILSTILILNFVGFFLKDLHSQKSIKKNNKDLSNVIRAKKIFFYIGILCALVLLSVTIFCCFLETTSTEIEKMIYASLIILIAVIPNGYLVLLYLNYKIIINQDHFIIQNFWHKKKKIYFKDIIIDKSKIYPQVRLKTNNTTKLIFKLAGILDNENLFLEAYKKWRSSKK